MRVLIPLTVAAPLLMAALLIIFARLIPRRLADLITILTSAAIAGLCCYLAVKAMRIDTVYWYGGWLPRNGVAIGICFVVDLFSAAFSALAAILVTAAIVFSWHYFQTVRNLYHALMLVFLAALNGFALTGDLFTMFVFFELMSVAAYALAGHKVEASSMEGALTFTITNSIGGFLILMGVGLIYGRTGALNMAQLGNAVAALPSEGLVTISFLLIIVGLFVKCAIVPFHFWLDDTYAIAPTPVCIIFAGIMSEIGLYAVARIYWSVYSGSLGPHSLELREVLIVMGVLTSVIGAILCFAQRHIKRLLAFSNISHSGIILAGVGALDAKGFAGASVYILGHGLIKGALFICAGILLHKFSSVDEFDLCGKARHLYFTAALVVLGAFGLTDVPPFATYLGKAWLDDATARIGYRWVGPLLLVTSAITGAAILRMAGRVFGGFSREEEGQEAESVSERKDGETREPRGGMAPAVMIVPAAVLMAAAIALPYVPGLRQTAAKSASKFINRQAYAAMVLQGSTPAVRITTGSMETGTKGIGYGCASAGLALVVGIGAFYRRRLPAIIRRSWQQTAGAGVNILQNLHTGHVGDYIVWLALGTAGLGIALVVATR